MLSRPAGLACSLLLIAACGPAGEQPPADSVPAAAPPALTLADVAGTWNVVNISERGDTVRSVLSGTADPSSWTTTLPGRDPVPVRVSIVGDSLITEAGPFESVLRPGIMVTTRTVSHLMGGRLMGTLEARYAGQADSLMRGQIEGTRAP